jgi:hypothetical protein
MELKAIELPLTGFGAAATPARVEILTLSPVDRIKGAAVIFGVSLLGAAIAIFIPLVHFVLVPAALILGAVFALLRLRQREIFRSAGGRCPFCSTEQSFTVMGRFKLPKKLYCSSCQRQLMLDEPTTGPPRSPTESPIRTPS